MKKTLRHIFMTRIGLWQATYFIGAIALILYFFPREEKSEYVFQEGKPWKYCLLTAAYDFPIYKSEAQLKHEQDSVIKTLRPFFTEESRVGTEQINNFKREHPELLQNAESADAYRYVLQALSEVYKRGIIATDTYNSLIHKGTPGVRIINRNTVKEECEVSDLLSLRSAYEYIMAHATAKQQKILNTCNLNNYLSENLTYDSLKSQNAQYELLQRIPSSIGMVQKGEKIINRGDIVTPRTFLILESLETVNQRNNTRTHQQEMFIMLGQAIVIICLFIFLYRYLAIFYPRTFNDPKKLAFIMIMITGTTVICYFLCGMFTTSGMYLVPFAILPITIVVFLKKSIALISSLISILLCAFAVPYPLEFIFLQMAVTVTANKQHEGVGKAFSTITMRYTHIRYLLLHVHGIHAYFRRVDQTRPTALLLLGHQLCTAILHLSAHISARKSFRICIDGNAGGIIGHQPAYFQTAIGNMPGYIPTFDAGIESRNRSGRQHWSPSAIGTHRSFVPRHR